MKTDVIVGVLLTAMMGASGVANAQTEKIQVPVTQTEASVSTGVFHGELEVSLVTLYATVVDKDRLPVSGLTAADFEVFEGGEAREITLFEAVDRSETRVTDFADLPDDPATAAEAQPTGDSVAVVFDNSRLERRARRRVLDSLENLIEPMRTQGSEVMVGVMNPRFEVILPFSSDSKNIASAFEKVGDTATIGEAIKSERRSLKRDVYGGLATASSGEMAEAMAIAEGIRLGVRIDSYREVEMQRAYEGLNRMESLVRSMATRSGRTSLVWVTEDMNFRPGVDIYRRYYTRFRTFLTLDEPDLWGLERNLRDEFDRVISAAQSTGVTVHVVDASNRDAEVADTDFRAQDIFTLTASQNAGPGSTMGYDFSEVYDSVEGSQYLGYGSGGDFFGNTRKFDGFIDSFVESTATYYVIGYARPVPGDGKTRTVRLEVKKPGLTVRHPAKVLDRTPEQRLTDSVVSHLIWGDGHNPLGLRVAVDENRDGEGGTVLWPVNLEIPAIGLLPGDDGRALVTVVISVGASDGTLSKPHQFRLVLPVPKDPSSAVGTATVTLSTRPEGDRVAVGIRDELTGATSTAMVGLTPSS